MFIQIFTLEYFLKSNIQKMNARIRFIKFISLNRLEWYIIVKHAQTIMFKDSENTKILKNKLRKMINII